MKNNASQLLTSFMSCSAQASTTMPRHLRTLMAHWLTLLAKAVLRAPPEVAFAMSSWPLFTLTFSIFSFLYVYCFWPTSEKLPRLKFSPSPYFGITTGCPRKKFRLGFEILYCWIAFSSSISCQFCLPYILKT